MFISFRQVALLTIIMLGVGNVKAQKDPCSMTEQLSGGKKWTSNASKDIGVCMNVVSYVKPVGEQAQ
ncbi:MAG: hypothetical protein K6A78_05435 [Prevotella sp.]|nr:hypothetical protein [Prevotella sp.]